MKSRLIMISLIAAALTGAGAPLLAGSPYGAEPVEVSYYGDNDLVDLYQAGVLRKFAASSVALFSDRVVVKDEATGAYKLTPISLKDKLNLQPNQPFGDQTVGAFCSGALVGPDLVLTAGHCFAPDERGGPCERVKMVFGYAVTRAGEIPSTFPADDVYSCKKILVQKVQDEGHSLDCRNGACTEGTPGELGADYALIKLDRKVKGRYPLAISRSRIASGAEVGVIGYPSGLPVKVQEKGATVRELKTGYFTTNLDTFRGNSGSPVFNMRTLKIEGVVSRGGTDYIYDTAPNEVNDPRRPYNYTPGRANYYPQDGGRGEDATFITEIQSLIPVSEAERSLDSMLQKAGASGGKTPKVVPAIYVPGDNGLSVQPAVYTVPDVEPAPATMSI